MAALAEEAHATKWRLNHACEPRGVPERQRSTLSDKTAKARRAHGWGVENDLIHRPWLACNRAVLIVAHDFACGFLKGRPYPGRKAEPTLEPLGPQGENLASLGARCAYLPTSRAPRSLFRCKISGYDREHIRDLCSRLSYRRDGSQGNPPTWDSLRSRS